MEGMSLCFVCCYSFPPPQPPPGEEEENTLTTFTKQVDEKGGSRAIFGRDKGLSVCPECLSLVGRAVGKREAMDEVEVQVRHLQREILRLMRDLEGLVGEYLEEMRWIKDRIEGGDEACLISQRKMKKGDGVWALRNGVVNLVEQLSRFQNEKRSSIPAAVVDIDEGDEPDEGEPEEVITVKMEPTEETNDHPPPPQKKDKLLDDLLRMPDYFTPTPEQAAKRAEVEQKFQATFAMLTNKPATSVPSQRKLTAPPKSKKNWNKNTKIPAKSKPKAPPTFKPDPESSSSDEDSPSEDSEYQVSEDTSDPDFSDKSCSDSDDDLPCTCALCKSTFPTTAKLVAHKVKFHWKGQCPECGYKTNSKLTAGIVPHMRLHIQRKHPELFPELLFSCPTCKLQLSSQKRLDNHLQKIHPKSHPCPECKLKCDSKLELLRHKQKLHGERRFVCEDCGKPFINLKYLNRHMWTHKSKAERKWACETCGKTFVKHHDLKRHVRIHTGETPFVCEHCGKRFTLNANLKLHLRRKHPEDG